MSPGGSIQVLRKCLEGTLGDATKTVKMPKFATFVPAAKRPQGTVAKSAIDRGKPPALGINPHRASVEKRGEAIGF
jgi:hypothetical protein